MDGHTLLLFQKDNSPDSRTWTEHDNATLAVEAIITMYETRLAESHPTRGYINYQVGDLIGFISQCKEFAALVYDQKLYAYVPRDKAWLQEKTVTYLRNKLINQKYTNGGTLNDHYQGGNWKMK